MAAAANSGEQWKCSDRFCSSGQTSFDRNEYGRKVISDFFGRNKTATKAIPDDVWHWQCRKGYQRSKYAADNGTAEDHKAFFLGHLRDQITRISLWRPEATFTIQLSKPAKERLSKYHSQLRQNGNNIKDAEAHVAAVPKAGKGDKALSSALADAVRPHHAEHIDSNFAGEGRPLTFITDTVFPWIEAEFTSGGMVRMPPIEFLIEPPSQGDTITAPGENHVLWLAHLDGGRSGHGTATVPPKSSSDRKHKAEDDETCTQPKRPKIILRIPSTRDRLSPPSPTTIEAANILLNLRDTSRPSFRADELPLYVPPPPIVRPKYPASPEISPRTKPVMACGMVFAAAKGSKDFDEYDSDDTDSEIGDEST